MSSYEGLPREQVGEFGRSSWGATASESEPTAEFDEEVEASLGELGAKNPEMAALVRELGPEKLSRFDRLTNLGGVMTIRDLEYLKAPEAAELFEQFAEAQDAAAEKRIYTAIAERVESAAFES